MDPFKVLPEELFENILKHLNAAEVLQSSLVSKRWYLSIGRSKACMDKIVVSLISNIHRFDMSPILESKRLYQNISLLFLSAMLKRHPNSVRSIRSIINKFSGSIKSIYTLNDFQRILDLPKLTDLTISTLDWRNVGLLNSGGLLTKARNLTKLTIRCMRMDKVSVKFMRKTLKDLKHLKILAVDNLSILKDWNFNDCKFKLEEFNWCEYSYLSRQQSADIFNFMRVHSSTLTSIVLSKASYENMVSLLSDFPKLRQLSIMCCSYVEGEMQNYPVNNSIKMLQVKNMFPVTYGENNNMSKILPKLRKLEVLKIYELTGEAVQVISDSKTIKTVEYRLLKDVDWNQFQLLRSNKQVNFAYKARE